MCTYSMTKHQICEVQYVWPSSLTYVCTPHMHTYVHTCTFGLTLKFMYISYIRTVAATVSRNVHAHTYVRT